MPEAPSAWMKTVLTGLLKRGKDKGDPNNYCAIGLESCGLKMMTLLIHKRLTQWCESKMLKWYPNYKPRASR